MIPEERLRAPGGLCRAELVVERSVASISTPGCVGVDSNVLAGAVVIVAILELLVDGAPSRTGLPISRRSAAHERGRPIEAEIFDTEVLDVEVVLQQRGFDRRRGVLGASSSIVSVADGFVGVTAETGALTVARSPTGCRGTRSRW